MLFRYVRTYNTLCLVDFNFIYFINNEIHNYLYSSLWQKYSSKKKTILKSLTKKI